MRMAGSALDHMFDPRRINFGEMHGQSYLNRANEQASGMQADAVNKFADIEGQLAMGQAEGNAELAKAQGAANKQNAIMGGVSSLVGGIGGMFGGGGGGGGGAVSSSPFAAPAQSSFKSYFQGFGG